MPRRKVETEADWELVIGAAMRLQEIVKGATLVGGSGAALHVRHRFSYDDDHVVHDLRDRFDSVLVQRPVQILGSLDGIDTGIRQLRRAPPLETELVASADGPIRIPTLPEMLRIKAWLVVTRNATRDYVDSAALAAHLRRTQGVTAPVEALKSLDSLYPQENGESVSRQLAKQLADPLPYDLQQDAFSELRGLKSPWTSWSSVATALRALAAEIEVARSTY